MKRSSLIVALVIMLVAQPVAAMDEPEVWNCEFFSFSKELFKDLIISLRFKCNEAAAADQLFTAIRNKNVTEVGSLLYEHPMLLDTAQDSDGLTPLLAATIAGNDAIVAHMLSRQPQVDRRSHQGFTIITINGKPSWLPIAGLTPLMVAAKCEHRNIVRQLLGAGARKDLEDEGRPKKNALDYAKETGNIDIVNLLQ